jgi:DNA-directed RNA polymerases I and III subunit RPAC1
MVDEVFAHRLGMIPLNVDPALIETKENPNDQATDRNTIVFKLKVDCTRNLLAPRDCTDSAALYNNSEVLARDLQWEPQGEQLEIFAKRPPAPTIPETVLVKMRPGQGVEMEMHAVKGLGKDHAKFSPVGTCAPGPSPLTLAQTVESGLVQQLRAIGYYRTSFWTMQIPYLLNLQHVSRIASHPGSST